MKTAKSKVCLKRLSMSWAIVVLGLFTRYSGKGFVKLVFCLVQEWFLRCIVVSMK